MNASSRRQNRAALFYICFAISILTIVTVLRIVIAPFIIALILAYVCNPFIESLERRGIPRSIIVVTSIATSLFVLFSIFWFLLPTVYHQAEILFKMLPQLKEHLETKWIPKIHSFLGNTILPSLKNSKVSQLSDIINLSSESPSNLLLNSIGNSTKFLITWIAAGILAPIFAFFVMKDFRRILLRVLTLVPPDLRGNFLRLVSEADLTLRAVLRGQILVISVLSALYGGTLYAVGLPAGLIVGICTGLARLVPYLDLVVGGTLCFLILITNASPISTVAGVIASFIAVQVIDGLFLTPRIMGQFSGLHPFVIILSVLTFGDWFGFYGVLLAIPSAAVLRVAMINLLEAYKESKFYKNAPER